MTTLRLTLAFMGGMMTMAAAVTAVCVRRYRDEVTR